MIQRIKIIIIFLLSTFLLNFFWESLHAVYLYKGYNLLIKQYVNIISYVSFIDMLLLIGIFIVGILIWKNFFWFKNMNKKKYWYMVISTMLVAIVIEIKGIYLFHQWSYNKLMPTIFGIGISPLIQLTVTGLISIWLIREMVDL